MTASLPVSQPNTIFSVSQVPDLVARTTGYSQLGSGGQRVSNIIAQAGWFVRLSASTTAQTIGKITDVFIPFSTQVEFNTTNSSYSFNGNPKESISLGTANMSDFSVGSPSTLLGQLTSFAAVISSQNVPILHELYKSTLGQGLGLP
jgi:hypothetical protein